MTDLQTATLEVIADELQRRFDSVIVTAYSAEQKKSVYTIRGRYYECLRLADIVHEELLKSDAINFPEKTE